MTGSSFYLWVLEGFPVLARQVEFILQERTGASCDDPDCGCELRPGVEEEFLASTSS